METSDICWAFHSDCKEDLLTVIPSMSRNSTTWKDLRDHGAGWWIRSNDMLKRTIEKVAFLLLSCFFHNYMFYILTILH